VVKGNDNAAFNPWCPLTKAFINGKDAVLGHCFALKD
jgi:hypothetical protein